MEQIALFITIAFFVHVGSSFVGFVVFVLESVNVSSNAFSVFLGFWFFLVLGERDVTVALVVVGGNTRDRVDLVGTSILV